MRSAAAPQTVVGAVIIDRGNVLAARRTKPASLAGSWEFPGGKVEPGEDPTAALEREIAEELGVGITVGDELPGPDGGWPISSAYMLRLFFAAVDVDGAAEAGPDHDQLRWLAPAELESVPWLAADRQALGTVTAYLARLPRQ
jgi:8-oxo-dGTP diphosphatase